MSDVFLKLGQNPYARRMVKTLGLPLPMPQPLRRSHGPAAPNPLQGRTAVVGGAAHSSLAAPVARVMDASGARVQVAGSAALRERFANGSSLPEGAADARADALVFDASWLASVADLHAVYDFFHPLVGALGSSGRALVIGRPPDEADTAEEASVRAALDGFTRSLAREVGRRGATANLVFAHAGAEDRLAGVMRFLLSERSAFVTGQPFHVSARAAAGGDQEDAQALAGKVALVTGAARGIGAVTAERLAEEGARVLCLDRPEDAELAREVAERCGGSVLSVDVRDSGAPAQIASSLADEHGGVDIVVHNAGVTRDKTLARMARSAWEDAVEINLGAPVAITRELVARELVRDGGRVICLSSVAGLAGNMGQTNYAAAKAGVVGFVRGEAGALASKGITVNAVAPGFIETRLTDAMPVVVREVGRRLSSLGQGGQPRDVAEAISFLAAPASAGLTGQVMRVCGGAFVGA